MGQGLAATGSKANNDEICASGTIPTLVRLLQCGIAEPAREPVVLTLMYLLMQGECYEEPICSAGAIAAFSRLAQKDMQSRDHELSAQAFELLAQGNDQTIEALRGSTVSSLLHQL